MKIFIFSLCFLTLLNTCFAIENPLFPEDGSQKMNKWYYTSKYLPQEIIEAFAHQDVQAIKIKYPYPFFQDLAAFDSTGQFILQADLGTSHSINKDLTIGIYENMGSFGELKRLDQTSLYDTDLKTTQFEYAFFEGGGLISGRFNNKEPYVIINYLRYDNLKRAAQLKDPTITDKLFQNILANDLRVLPNNLIVIRDPRFINQHLDLSIKALPNGVLLIDSPTQTLALLNKILPQSEEQKNELDRMKIYYTSSQFENSRTLYEAHISAITKALTKKFKIIQIPGRFFSVDPNNVNKVVDQVNFFNGVSSINSHGESFYITNRSESIKQLEFFWAKQMQKFGFLSKNIHFVGQYSDGAGLDCLGAPAP